MNKFNNPRLTNTTVSGTGVKHPMRPHVILGDPENGFIRGDLLDANAVIKLIKNAAKAIGALEELEQSNWIDDNAKTEESAEETVGVLQPGEVGIVVDPVSFKKLLIYNNNGALNVVSYPQGATSLVLNLEDSKAYGMSIESAMTAGYVVAGEQVGPTAPATQLNTVKGLIINYATMSI